MNGTVEDGQSATLSFAREPAAAPIEPPISEPVEEQPPAEEQPAAEQQPQATSAPWDMPVNRDSDPALIEQMQDILAQWGWLTLDVEGGATRGQLDEVTLNAILEFQNYVNEQYAQGGTPLVLIDLTADNPEVGTDTLKLIFNDQDINIAKP